MANLNVDIAGVTLKNPVMPASGTYEYNGIHDNIFPPNKLGAVLNKTVFIEPREGNKPPRICETPCGMLNSIGIPTEGADSFIKNKLPVLASFEVPVIVSIAGNTIEDFCKLACIMENTGKADLLELNLSCPNLRHGIEWARDKKQLYKIIKRIKESVRIPIIAKLSPSVDDISEMALIAESAGADAVALINTYKGMKIDIAKRRPLLGNTTGGLSGPAVHPLAVYAVYSTFTKISIPIIGIGGIASWEDAVEMILAGSTAVGIGMYNFVNPAVMGEIIEGINHYLEENNFDSTTEIIGLAHF